MADQHLERERTYDVPADFVLPELGESERRTYELEATYYDTDDGLLQARGVTLRHRVGGKDDGWHLKVPHPDGKLEIHVDSEASSPPDELVRLTRGLRLERPLHERAVLRTTRDAYEFHSNDRVLLAELADDTVVATSAGAEVGVRWREVEIEMGPAGTVGVCDGLADRLRAAGAVPSTHGSKLARALGDPATKPSLPGVGGVVDSYLHKQYERVAWGDLRLRRDENVVHKTRVAVRRIRSTLRIFAPLFDTRVAHLDAELSWYADVLGRVRDLAVLRRTVEDDLASDPDLVAGPEAAGGLRHVLEEESRRAWAELRTVLDSARYLDLLREIDRWRLQAPMTPDAEAGAKRVERFLRRAEKKSDRRLERAAAAHGDKVDTALHRARKAAKRTRYAAELALPKLGKPAKRIAKAHERRQDALGEVQDHAMTVAALRELAATKDITAEVAFLCGALAQRHADEKVGARSRWR